MRSVIKYIAASILSAISVGPVEPNDPVPPSTSNTPSAHELAVDDDIFVLYAMAGELCDQAREMIEDGISRDDMMDSAVDVLASKTDGFIVTEEATFYLRGLLVGCLN